MIKLELQKSIGRLLLLSLLLIAYGCQKKAGTVAGDKVEYPDQEGWNSTVISSRNGVVNATIHYGHMQQFKKKKMVEFEQGVQVDFFNEQGLHTSKLTADSGRLNEATNDIEAIGNVIVVSDTGITLTTERLRWDSNIEKIVSNDFVTIVTAEQDTFYGQGFESDQNLQNWRIIAFSGKAGRGLPLNYKVERKKRSNDSSAIKSVPGPVDSTAGRQ